MTSQMNLQIAYKINSYCGDEQELLECQINNFTYYFGNNLAVLRLPIFSCADMIGAIAYCKIINKNVQSIDVYEDDCLINVYVFNNGEWKATFSSRHELSGESVK